MAPISVLVVDDSVVVRRLVTTALDDEPEISVIGTSSNGDLAIKRLEQSLPDVVTLDIEMPVMDGLQCMREIHKRWPRLPVIMFSTLTEKGAGATLEALSAGASDYVTKPANVGSVTESLATVRDQLVPKILALAGRRRPSAPPVATSRAATLPPQRPAPAATGATRTSLPATTMGPVDIVAIGCSTGGPEALTSVLTALPADFPVPIVVVQHMPKVFTKLFAERLDSSTKLTVHEATTRMTLQAGHVYLAPGDFHLQVEMAGKGVSTSLNQAPPENFCRPAVDPLFRSVAAAYGPKVLAVILTGMGSDGRAGAEVLKAAGGRVLAQDEATSVVWGMPGAVTTAGLADAVLPLGEIPSYVLAAIRPAGGAAPARAAGSTALGGRTR